jgi:hypothetical protein
MSDVLIQPTESAADYERRCSFDQPALDLAQHLEAVFVSEPKYLRVTKAQIAITELLMASTVTPPPGRAAELDTMGEVERLVRTFSASINVFWTESQAGSRSDCLMAEQALLSAVRAIVTERDAFKADRDEWKSNYENLFESRDLRVAALRTRAETAEAQLATLRAEVEGLRAALKPFAAVATRDIGQDEGDMDYFRPAVEHNRAPRLKVGDFRRAAAIFMGFDQ